MARVLCLLNGGDVDAERVQSWMHQADVVYATDGAADRSLRMGVRPVVVGDMDSVEARHEWPEAQHSADQSTTDFEKLLTLVESNGHQDVLIVGIEGDRPDHFLASLSALAASDVSIWVMFRSGLATVVRSGTSVALHVPSATTFSVIPLPDALVTIQGAEWPVDSQLFSIGKSLSISNKTTGVATISVESGTALVFVHTFGDVWEPLWTTKPLVSG